ncbi:MAG TPA: penicillin-binding protein activator [Anaerolineae bacterium]|nr:penicillin-binding protein activator [Anaerolineae bacterium]
MKTKIVLMVLCVVVLALVAVQVSPASVVAAQATASATTTGAAATTGTPEATGTAAATTTSEATSAPQATSVPVTPSAGAAAPQEITIGVVLPFTGSLGQFGIGFREGVELAVEQMNTRLKDAGRNITFKIASADTTGTPDGAAKAFQTVVQTSGAQVVVGPLATSEVLGAKQFADANHIVIIAPASTAQGAAIPDDYIFRVFDPPDAFAAQAFLGIAQQRGYQNIVVLHVDDPFGNGMFSALSNGFKGTLSEVKYPNNPADLSGEITKVSSEIARLSPSGKTAFFCVCFLGDAQKVAQQAIADVNLGTVDWLGVENLRSKDLLTSDIGPVLSKANFTTVSFIGSQNPNTQPYLDAYKAKFGHDSGPFTNYAYDAANIAMLSVLVAGNDGQAIQKIVPFIADHYIGTEVQAFLDANGDQAIAAYGIYQVNKDGTDFTQIGTYDSASGKVTLTTP